MTNTANTNQINNSHMTGTGAYSSLLSDQIYNKHGRTGGQNPYKEDNKTYQEKQNWEKAPIYKDAQTNAEPVKKFKRFSDLKIINEQMISLANNIQSDNSPIEVLSQGQKGEIKNLLGVRILKISWLPSIAIVILTGTLVFTDYLLFTLMALVIYFYILGRTFFYPAKLYYENIQYTTTEHAKLFFEEVDFWYKTGVVQTLLLFIISIICSFIILFYEDNLVNFILNIANSSRDSMKQILIHYASTISFTYSLVLAIVLYIVTILMYFKFINKEKEKNTKLLIARIKDIRNQTMSRVEQIQMDKNEIY
jgi:hypothetical protein